MSFTLIELLVVVAIIAVLISILMPALRKARDFSRQVACNNNLRQVGCLLHYYIDDHDGTYPPTRQAYGGTGPYPQEVLKVYLSNPFNTRYNLNKNVAGPFYCPANNLEDPASAYPVLSYGYNYHLGALDVGVAWQESFKKMKYPSTTIYMSDGTKDTAMAATGWPFKTSSTRIQVQYRHRNMANNLFLDNHVEAMSFSDMANQRKLINPF